MKNFEIIKKSGRVDLADPRFKQPDNPDIKIWRYMSLEKLLNSLHHGGLYLCRADLLGDKFEGAVTPATIEVRKNLGQDISIPEEALRKNPENNYISCWHASDFETDFMWKYYGGLNGAVAIQSTYSKLIAAIDAKSNSPPEWKWCYLGMVKYVTESDPIPELANLKDRGERGDLLQRFFYKRAPFKPEAEIRLLRWAPFSSQEIKESFNGNIPKGFYLTLDFDLLIDKILISPLAAQGTSDTLKSILKNHYTLSKDIELSFLASDPIF